MDFDDRRPFEKTDNSISLAVKIGVAVFIAIVAAAALRWAYAYWVMRQVGESFQKSMVQMQVDTQARLELARAKEQIRLEQIAQARAFEIEQQRRAREEEELRLRQQQQMMIAKENAWKEFFKPRVECDNPRSNQEFVECGNDHMRAKARFEKTWQAKMLTIQSVMYP